MRSLLVLLLLAFPCFAQDVAVSGRLSIEANTSKLVGDHKTDNTAELTRLLQGGGIVELPPGKFVANVELDNVKGLVLRGSGKLATQIISGKRNTPALRINGCWYSKVEDIGFGTISGLDCGALEIDGGTEIGIQGNTFQDLIVNGQGTQDGLYSRYCMTMAAKTKGEPPQGSENLYLNCHFLGASQACYYQWGFNALNNTFVGGNFQAYSKNGIEVICGSVQVLSVGFQSTTGYQQILNDGWDIKSTAGGAYDSIFIAGCRTESLRFAAFSWSQFPQIMSCYQMPGIQVWSPGYQFKKDAVCQLDGKLYLCLKDSDDTEFDAKDWKQVDFNVVDIVSGTVTNCTWQIGNVKQDATFGSRCPTVRGDYLLKPNDAGLLVAVTDRPITVTLYPASEAIEGKEVVIVRTGNAAHQVKVVFGSETVILKTQKSVRLKALGKWFVL